MNLLNTFFLLLLSINSVITINLENPNWVKFKVSYNVFTCKCFNRKFIYQEKYNLSFDDESEELKRFLIFHFNYMRVNRHNSKYAIGNETYSQALYDLHCFTKSEVKKVRKGIKVPK